MKKLKGILIKPVDSVRYWFARSIRNKLMISVLMIFLVVYGITIGYVYNRTKIDVINGARQEALSTAQIITTAIYRNYEIPEDFREIQSFIIGTKRYKKNIIELSVISRELIVIGSTNDGMLNKLIDNGIYRIIIQNNNADINLKYNSDNPFIHIIYPISAGLSKKNLVTGLIDLHISLELQMRNLSKIRNNILFSGITIFIAIFIVISLLTRSITKPIYNLYTGAKKAKRGNLDMQVVVKSSDEIGYLTSYFNDLILSIKSSKKKLEDFSNTTVNLSSVIQYLREAYEREQRFASDVAHELRTPISEIRTLVEVVLKYAEELSTVDRNNYSDILESVKHIQNTVNNLLMLSRYDSNALECKKEKFELNEIIEKTCERYAGLAASRNIVFKRRISGPLILCSDREIFQAIIDNLLSNSVEYSENNSEIMVTGSSDENHFKLTVINLAENLSRSDLPLMFDRFWRKDVARNADSNHSGLGLSLVKSFADFLGFKIETELLRNSRFTITISGQRE